MPEKLHPFYRAAAIFIGTASIFSATIFAIELYYNSAWKYSFSPLGFFAFGMLFMYVGITGKNLRYESSDEDEDA